jgi:hypothetical protein
MGTMCVVTSSFAASGRVSNPLRVSYQLVKECPGFRVGDEPQSQCTVQRIIDRNSDEIDIPGIHLADYQF